MTFYNNVFNSKLDIFNGIRLTISSTSDPDAMSQIGQYGFSSNILFNLAG